MAKKQTLAGYLEGIAQPVSADNVPELYKPLMPGDDFDENLLFESLNKQDNPDEEEGFSPFNNRPKLDYKGKYYKGSAQDPFQKTIQGENQPWISKLTNGLVGNTMSVGTKAVTMAGETVGGAWDLISNIMVPGLAQERKAEKGTMFPHLFENFVTQGMRYVEDDLIEKKLLPVYGGQKYYSDNLLTKMGDMKFWSSDAADAVAFTAAAWITAGAFTKAAKGMGWVTKVLDKTGKEVINLSTKGKIFSESGTAIANTIGEAAMEGYDGLTKMRDDLALRDYGVTYDYLTPDKKASINEKAGPYAANIFNANAGILLGPNLIQARFFIGPVKSSSEKLMKAVRAGTLTPEQISMTKRALKYAGIGIISEGLWEEGMQQAVQNYEKSKANGTAFLDRMPGYAYEWVNNWYDTEGQQSMLLGGLIGLGMGSARGMIDSRNEKKAVIEYKDRFDKAIKNYLNVADNVFPTNIKIPYKTFQREVADKDGNKKTITSILNDQGKTEWDFDKVLKLYQADMAKKELFDNLRMAVLNNDEIHEKFFLNMALGQLFIEYATNNVFEDSKVAYETLLARNPIGKLAEDQDLKALGLDYDYMKRRLDDMSREWNEMQSNLKGKLDLENNSPAYLEFRSKLEKADFYNRMKLRWLDDVDNLVSDKKQVEGLRKDAEDAIKLFEDKKDREKLYKEYIERESIPINIDKQLKEEEKKDRNSAEAKKFRYLRDEEKKINGQGKLHDVFTITESMEKKIGELGLKNQHYLNIAADAIVGLRLQSIMDKVSSGRATLKDVVDLLDSPMKGTMETRGKFDITKEDIAEIRKLIKIDNDNIENNPAKMTAEMVESEVSKLDEMLYNPEPGKEITKDKYDEQVDLLREAYQSYENKKNDHNEAVKRINEFETTTEGRGLLNYADNISKLEKDDDVFLRNVAEEPVTAGKNLVKNFKSNTEAYDDIDYVKRLVQELKDRKEIYENTDLKERLTRKQFKGFIESIDKVLATIEKDLLPIVEVNSKEKKNADKQGQKNRNRKRFIGVGVSINPDNTYEVTDKELYEQIRIIVPTIDKIIQESSEASEAGDEYAFHEAFIDKILTIINDPKNKGKKDVLLKYLEKKYTSSIDELVTFYKSVTYESGTRLQRYKENPAKVFKDLIYQVTGVRNDGVNRKTAIDKYKNNNDILDFKNNLLSESETGYTADNKDILLGFVNRHIVIESLQNMIDYLESDYSLADEIKAEKAAFELIGKAPTNQQLSAIRKAVIWYKKPLRKLTSQSKELHRFINWLFIKGNAGTGKTQVIIKLLTNVLGIKAEEIELLAPHQKAIDMLKSQNVSVNEPILISTLDTIKDTTKVVIVDEIAAINNPDLMTLAGKLQTINENRKVPLRVIVMGDPSQVSAQENTTKVTAEPSINETRETGTEYISVVDPLTIKHRSVIPELNEVLNIYEDNYSEVQGITVVASDIVGRKSIGVHAGNIEKLKEMIKAHRNNNKSKIIVVSTKTEKESIVKDPDFADYKDSVYVFSEIAGTECDEAYVILSRDQFKDTIEYNRAVYTAASRARQYIFLYDKTGKFNNSHNKDMERYFDQDGKYNKDLQKTLEERKQAFKDRLEIEANILKGTVYKPEKQKQPPKKKIEDEEEITEKETPGGGIDVIYPDPESDNDNGTDEEDSSGNEIIIEVGPDKILDRIHRVKFPTAFGVNKIKGDEEGLSPRLLPNSEVIYVRDEDTTDENDYTIHILGQLYGPNEKTNKIDKKLEGAYAHLGIVSNEELNGQLIHIKQAADATDKIGSVIIDPSSQIARISMSDKKANLDKVIVGRGRLVHARPLTYRYSKKDIPTYSGKGFIDKILDLINHKLFNRDKDSTVTYQIKIFSHKELEGDLYKDIKDKKLFAGVPYLLISRTRNNKTRQKTQFIRLNPTNLAKDSDIISVLTKFTNSINDLENSVNGKGRLGEELFNEMIDAFKVNYYLDGDNVAYKDRNITYEDYKKKADAGYVLDLSKEEFVRAEILMTEIIPMLYGKGKARIKVADEATMIEMYNLDKDLENKDEGAKYEFKATKKGGGYVIKYNIKDAKDKGEIQYKDTLVKGHGEAQQKLNILAKANAEINGKPIRVRRKTFRGEGDKKTISFTITGKSLLSTESYNDGYFSDLRKLMEQAHLTFGAEWKKDKFGEEYLYTASPWITDENVEEAEKILMDAGVITDTELEEIKAKHYNEPITSTTLNDIVSFGPGSTIHQTLRTPLMMLDINEWGENPESIEENKDKLERYLQSHIEDILPTSVEVELDQEPQKKGEIVEKTFEVKKNELEDLKRDIDIEKRNLMRDTGKDILGNKRTEKSIRRMIKRRIPGIKNDEIVFMEKHLIDDLAGESAWGLYKDGIMYLTKNEDGTTYENIARHEVFHKVYNEFLTPEEQIKVDEMAKKEFLDYGDYSSIEELLAQKYHAWRRGVLGKISDFFKKLFIKIQQLLNIYERNFDTIEDLYFQITQGLIDYRHNNGENTSRSMKEMKKRFGTVQEYINSMNYLIRKFKQYRIDGIDGIHSTHEEIRKEILADLSRKVILLKKQIRETNSEEEKVDLTRILKRFIRTRNYFKDLAHDLFPGFNNYTAGIFKANLHEDIKAELYNEERPAIKGKSQYIENNRHNTELDVTDEVKEFLSFIQVLSEKDRKSEGKLIEGTRDGDFLSWRYVYVKLIDMFEGVSLEQGNVIEQLKENFKNKELTKNEQAILDFINNVYNSFSRNKTIQDTKLDNKYKYLTDSIFIYAKKNVDLIKHLDDPRIRSGEVTKIIKRQGETSVQFAERIMNETGLTKNQLINYSTRQYYNEMWNRLVNHFNSHRQREPKIGERMISYGSYEIRYINARGNAVSNGISDRLKYIINNKFKTRDSVEKFVKYQLKQWEEKYKKNSLGFIREFLNYVGLPQYANAITTHNADQIKSDIIYTFPRLLEEKLGDLVSTEDGDTVEEDQIHNDESEEQGPAVYTVDYLLEKHHKSFLNHLTSSISLLDNLNRILSSNDAKKNKRYNAVLTSQAHKNLFNIIHAKYFTKNTGLDSLQLNEAFRGKFLKNNIFIKGLNRIFRIIDDDGLRYDDRSGNEYAIEYRNEKREDFNFRQFVLGFLTNIAHSGEKRLKYIQYVTPNERKTPFGAEVRVLKRDQLIASIQQIITQLKERDIENEKKYANYKNDSYLGFEVLNEVLPKEISLQDVDTEKSNVTSYQLALQIYNLLDKRSYKATKNIVADRTAFDSDMPLTKQFDDVIDSNLYPEFTVQFIPRNNSGHLKLYETWDEFEARNITEGLNRSNAYDRGVEREYLLKEKHIQPLVSSYFINNYVNGYQLTQLVVGDLAGFENTTDAVRRITNAFSPGKSGFIHDKYGMNRYARVAVIADPIKDSDTVKSYIKALMPEWNDTEIEEHMKLFPEGGFKPGDSQGFILPERLQDINFGFGEDYGNVIKGVYYSIGTDGLARNIKYSSIVLSDQLCENNPLLSKLRDKMRNNMIDGKPAPIDEVVFASAVKVGLPSVTNDWYLMMNDANNLGFHPDSQFIMDNKDFRIQLDPEAELDDDVSYPTQLSYIMNLYGVNNTIADDIYRSFANIIKSNFESLEAWMGNKSLKTIIENFLEKSNQESLKELLDDGIDPNFPGITDKLVVHYISRMFDRAVKTKFAGSKKLILQSALGAEKAFKSAGVQLEEQFARELEFKRDKQGRLYAECIVPKGLIQKDIEDRIQNALDKGEEPDDFFIYNNGKQNVQSKDFAGFRIPSSELHSAVPVKIVGFYDDIGTNVIIAPKLLVVLHGSDFDIDSLSAITREVYDAFDKKVPVGYRWDEKIKKYVFIRDFTNDLNAIADPKIRRKATEAYYLNRILENFLEAVTSEDNIKRMLSPISLTELHEEKARVLKKSRQKEMDYDLSDSNDQQEIHSLIYTGENGIGMFMSLFKAFAFMHRAKQGHAITELKSEIREGKEKKREGYKIRFNNENYNSMVDIDEEGKASGYRFDSLGNAALDNFKEQILPYLNAGRETIRAYSVMVMHGIKFKTINNFIAQPILKYFTKYGYRDSGYLRRKLADYFKETDLKGIELTDKEMESYLKYTPEEINELLEKEKLTNKEAEFLKYQLAIYEQYNVLKILGEGIAKVARIANSIRTFPVKIEEMEDILSDAKSILGIDSDSSITDSTPSDDLSTYPYYMNEFLTTNPHIREALKVMEYTVKKVNSEFVIHSKTFRHIANKVISLTGIKLDKNSDTSKKKIRDEFVKFIMTAFVNRDNIKPVDIPSRKKDKKIVTLTGLHAYNKQFVNMVLEAQEMDQTKVAESLRRGDEIPYQGNMFLNSLSIKTNYKTGRESVNFYGPSSMNSIDYNLYKKSFEELNNFDFDFINGKYIYHSNVTLKKGEYTKFQKMFVEYAMLNFGMAFGVRNYTKVLPGSVYKDVSNELIQMLRNIENLQEKPLNNLINAFKSQIVLNFPESVYAKRIVPDGKNIHLRYKEGEIDEKTGKKKSIYHGEIDGMYYDRSFRSETVKEDWPEFHVEKFNDDYTVFKRLTDKEGLNALYIRIGHKNIDPLYNLESIQAGVNYNEEKQFDRKLRHVKGMILNDQYLENAALDLKEGDVISASDYTDPGSMYSNIYRVEKVMGAGYYKLKKAPKGLFSKYSIEEDSRIDVIYNTLIKRLSKRESNTRIFRGKILAKKYNLPEVINLYTAINNKEFNGLRVIYRQETANGVEILVNKEEIRNFLYGKQLDMFARYSTFDVADITDSIEKSEVIDQLETKTFTVSETVEDKIKQYSDAYDNKTSGQLLDDIENRTTSKFEKMLIKWIRIKLKERDVKYLGNNNIPSGYGRYYASGNIELDYNKLANDGRNIKFADRILLHEFVHATSLTQLLLDDEFRTQVQKWMNYVAQKGRFISDMFPVAFKDSAEFVAEYLSNEEFHDKISKIKLPDENKTIGQQILEWISKIFNYFGYKGYNATVGNYLDKWLSSTIKSNQYLELKDGRYYTKEGKDVTEIVDTTALYSFNIKEAENLSKVIEQSLGLHAVLDEKGMETDIYVDAEGREYKRVTDIRTGFISHFRRAGKNITFGERMAENEWGNIDHEVKRNIDGSMLTYDEFKKLMDKRQLEAEVRGRILHLMNKLTIDKIYNEGQNEFAIKSEIQRIALAEYEVVDSKGDKNNIQLSLDPAKYNWFLENIKDIYETHGINVLNDNIAKELKDIVSAEVIISSEELGYAGTADMVIEHADGMLSIKDIATGVNFDRFISQRLLKYGDQNKQIMDSPRDRKKMQIMMYAFMIKIKNPDVKFRDLSVMWIPNKYQATSHDNMRKVEVEDFLAMIKTFMRDKQALNEAGIKEDIYDTLIKKSPRLFDVSEYTNDYEVKVHGAGPVHEAYQDKVIEQLMLDDKNPVGQAESIILQLQRLIGQAPVITKLGKSDYKNLSAKDQVAVRELTNRLIQLIADPEISLAVNPQLDVSLITSVIGNYSDMAVPQIQVWKKFRDIQAHRAVIEFEKKKIEHDGYFKDVLDEYYKNHPMLLRNKRYLNWNNYKKIFEFAYKEFDNNGSAQLRLKHRDLDGEEFLSLSQAQRDYLDFLNKHYASYFEGKNAYANEKVTYIFEKGVMKPASILESFNKDLQEHEKFHYYKGWFPKAQKEESEMIFEAGEGNYLKGLIDKKFIKDMLHRSLTYYLENKFEGRTHATMVLPLKYMGSKNIDNKREYTYNLEFSFDRFTNAIEYKKHMDPVYAFGEGVRAWLDMQKDGDQPMYANTIKMFEKKLTSDVLGRTIRQQLIRKPLRMPWNAYEDREIRADALLMLMKNWTSATLMWLKPFTGGGNGINAMMLQHKDSLKGTISAKIFGIEQDAIDTTLADSLFADKVYFSEFIPHAITGNLNRDKAWLLMRKLRYLPDNFDFKSSEKWLLSTRNKMISQSSMYAFHRIPEEFTSMITMISQLKHLKHPNDKFDNGKPKSIWDCYDVVKLENGEYDVVWTAGSRGKLKSGIGTMATYTDIKELIPQEIAKIKKVYEKLQGGYRKEEAAAIEVYVLGKIWINLKKFYPRLLLNAFASRRNELDMGYLKKTADRMEGEDIYVWMQRVNESRFRVLGKFFLATASGGMMKPQYKWSNMPPELKQHVIDAHITLGIWALAYVGYLKMFGDDKDDDTLKLWWKMYLMDNFIQQYSPKELLKIGVQGFQPVPLVRAMQTVDAFSKMTAAAWEVSLGDAEKAFTLQGDLKGWNQFKKSIPLFASYTDFIRRVEKSEDLTRILQMDQFSKWR